MQNGTYIVKHFLGGEHKMIAHNGTYRVFDIRTNKYVFRYITEESFTHVYSIVKQIPTEQKLYDIAVWMNGAIHETIPVNASYPICMHKIARLKTHRFYKNKLIKPTERK